MDRVKRSESGMITNPLTIGPEATLAELDEICSHYRVSGLPVVDEGMRLLGIVTNRDTRFVPEADFPLRLVSDVMTKMPLVTGPRRHQPRGSLAQAGHQQDRKAPAR